ncbi:DUF721 domain-containing protein [Rothia sp. ZJ932]|uniref:DUF721 domain-containing protein n=1 Tax=Rothia sp. ZJ932 TaxID=2810516 RepID=UPI001F07128D|nr:DciA family protein [Rothia sp. ZJ932]
MSQPVDPHRYEDEVDAPHALLNRLRISATARGEGRLNKAASKKLIRDFGAAMSATPGSKRKRSFYAHDPRLLGGYSGPSKSARDPKPLTELMETMIASRGWKEPVAVSSVLARWEQLVGAHLASYARPVSFNDSTVVIECQTTPQAVNLRMMTHEILKVFERELGAGVVQKIQVFGPETPSWKRGRRVAPGMRGPRDTYG